MSFGFSVGDAALLLQLAWRTVENSRRACGAYDELTQGLTSLHLVLRRLDSEIRKTESPINNPDDYRKEEFQIILSGCRKVLSVLDEILEKYNALSEQEKGSKRLWQRVRFGNEEMAGLGDQRNKLVYYTSTLNVFLSTVTMGSMGRVEKLMVEDRGKLRDIKSAVDGITGLLISRAHHEGSVLTAYNDDDRSVWKDFRRELIKDGFSSSIIRKHKSTIKAYITEITARGCFDEQGLHQQPQQEKQLDRGDNNVNVTPLPRKIDATAGESRNAGRDPTTDGASKSRTPDNADQSQPRKGTSNSRPTLSTEQAESGERSIRSRTSSHARQSQLEEGTSKSRSTKKAEQEPSGKAAILPGTSRNAMRATSENCTTHADASKTVKQSQAEEKAVKGTPVIAEHGQSKKPAVKARASMTAAQGQPEESAVVSGASKNAGHILSEKSSTKADPSGNDGRSQSEKTAVRSGPSRESGKCGVSPVEPNDHGRKASLDVGVLTQTESSGKEHARAKCPRAPRAVVDPRKETTSTSLPTVQETPKSGGKPPISSVQTSSSPKRPSNIRSTSLPTVQETPKSGGKPPISSVQTSSSPKQPSNIRSTSLPTVQETPKSGGKPPISSVQTSSSPKRPSNIRSTSLPTVQETPKSGGKPPISSVQTSSSPKRSSNMRSDAVHCTYQHTLQQCKDFISCVTNQLQRGILPRENWVHEESKRLNELITRDLLAKLELSDVRQDDEFGRSTRSIVVETQAMLTALTGSVERVSTSRQLNTIIQNYHQKIAPKCIATASARPLFSAPEDKSWREDCDATIKQIRCLLRELAGFDVASDPIFQKRLLWLKADVKTMLSAFKITTHPENEHWKWYDQISHWEQWFVKIVLNNGKWKTLNDINRGLRGESRAIIVCWHEEKYLITSHHGPPYWYQEASAGSADISKGMNTMTKPPAKHNPFDPRLFNVRMSRSQQRLDRIDEAENRNTEANSQPSKVVCVLGRSLPKEEIQVT